MKFQVGDRVRVTIDPTDSCRGEFHGEVGIITSIHPEYGLPYIIKFTNCTVEEVSKEAGTWLWQEEEIEHAPFQAGDKVKVPTQKSAGISYDDSLVVSDAKEQGQQYLTINRLMKGNIYGARLDEDVYVVGPANSIEGDFFLAKDLELYEEGRKNNNSEVHLGGGSKVITNGPATILILQDEQYTNKLFKGIAKCHAMDDFDPEKGFQIAFWRAVQKQANWHLKQLTK